MTWTVLVPVLVIVVAAGVWDLKQRRVPDWIWLIGIIPVVFSWITLDWGWQVLTADALIAGTGLFARLRGWWGMGDAKAIAWLAFAAGPVLALVAAAVAAFAIPARHFKGGGVPYAWLLATTYTPLVPAVAICASYAPAVANSLMSMPTV